MTAAAAPHCRVFGAPSRSRDRSAGRCRCRRGSRVAEVLGRPGAVGRCLLGLAFLLTALLRRAAAAVRHLVWCCAFTGLLLLPVLELLLPSWRVKVVAPAASVAPAWQIRPAEVARAPMQPAGDERTTVRKGRRPSRGLPLPRPHRPARRRRRRGIDGRSIERAAAGAAPERDRAPLHYPTAARLDRRFAARRRDGLAGPGPLPMSPRGCWCRRAAGWCVNPAGRAARLLPREIGLRGPSGCGSRPSGRCR